MDDRVTELVGDLRNDGTHPHETTRHGAVLDNAVGIVVAMGRLAPEQAEQILRELSRHTGIKLRHVAQLLIEWTRTGRLCADLRTELDRQLAGHRESPQVGV
ncbi:ANTAR domain-containing protein [Streptomyces sp. NPDC007084]|uniref:ANTAR domain-containing protein n=1 Tax=Streptomyces sp. NPDC007084 TaxID=3154313 RepID=UPI003453241A